MTQPITDQQLDDIDARAAAATEGPWGVYESGTLIDIAADLQDTGCGYRARREICRLEDEPLDNDPTHREWTGEEDWAQVQADAAYIAAMPPETARALVAEVRRLRARVAELEEAGTYARSVLAALCYDLEDPGSNAFGALYEISRATTGVDAPRDDAALALARHDAQVLRQAAQTLEETDRDDDAVNLLYLLADGTEAAARSAVPAPAGE